MNLVLYNILKIFGLIIIIFLVVYFIDWICYKIFKEQGKWKKLE